MKKCLVTLNYNDSNTTIKFLKKIITYKTIDRIVIVDNNSTDDSYVNLKKFREECGDKFDLLKTHKNGGYAFGNNYGCKYVINKYNPEYIIIANPDISFEETVVDDIVNVYNEKKDAAIVSCVMDCLSNTHLPKAWKLPDYKDCILENLIILRKLVGDKTRYDFSELSNNINKVEVVPGSFFVISTKSFLDVGGFDESTFLYYEENILAYKLKNKGYSNYLLGNKHYNHMHSISIDKTYATVKSKLDIAYRSRLIYIKKYLECKSLSILIYYLTYYCGRFNYICLRKLILTINNIRG